MISAFLNIMCTDSSDQSNWKFCLIVSRGVTISTHCNVDFCKYSSILKYQSRVNEDNAA